MIFTPQWIAAQTPQRYSSGFPFSYGLAVGSRGLKGRSLDAHWMHAGQSRSANTVSRPASAGQPQPTRPTRPAYVVVIALSGALVFLTTVGTTWTLLRHSLSRESGR